MTVRREDGESIEFELNPLDLPQSGSIEMEGRTWLRRLARASHTAAAGLSRDLGETGMDVRRHPLHRDAGARLDRSAPGPRRARGGHRGEPVRRALGAQLGLRRFSRPAGRSWIGPRADLEVELRGAEPAARHPQPPAVQYQPVSAELASSTRTSSTWTWRAWRISRAAGGPWNCGAAGRRAAEIEALRRTPFVEYERVSALKLRFLKLLFVRFLRERRKGSARAREFDAFVEREGDLLERFATYCALDEHQHRRDPEIWVWPQWPAPFQDPESAETRAFRQKRWRSVMFYQYLQWQIDAQLRRAQQRARDRRLSLGLYHDLALATDRCGSDLWAHRPFFVTGCRVGAPPDDFAPCGQDWAFPPPNSERHRENGYRLFADGIRKNCRHGGALRIDHVMRLFHLYWIPDGYDATAGAYVRERNEDLVRILALESVRNRVVVVGEDLGTVEPEIRKTLARYGMLSYRLFYFEKNPNGEFRRHEEYPAQALVSSTTHDLPTLAGFWVGDRSAGAPRRGRARRSRLPAAKRSAPARETEDTGPAVRAGADEAGDASFCGVLSRDERRSAQCHRGLSGDHALARFWPSTRRTSPRNSPSKTCPPPPGSTPTGAGRCVSAPRN